MKMRKKLSSIVAVIVVVAFGGFWFFGGSKAPNYEFIEVKKGIVVEEVSATGKVKAAHDVRLAFEKGGKVAHVYAFVGDVVKAGQLLIELESADAQADLAQAQAALLVVQAKLDELRRGARPEDVRLTETKVANAQKTLDDAKVNLENVKKRAVADLEDYYSEALTAMVKSVSIATHALYTITDIQIAHFSGFDQQAIQVADAKASAVQALLGSSGYGRATNDVISQLSGGAKAAIAKAQADGAQENIDSALVKTKSALNAVKVSLDAVPVVSVLTSTEATNLNTEKSGIAGELSTISDKQQGIAVQKIANQNSISSAEIKVNDALSALASAQSELVLKKAGSAYEVIAAAKAQVQEAEARVKGAQAQLLKNVLRSPLDGTVTKQDAKVGEIVGANTTLVSVISDSRFEIEVFIPEADVAKVKSGDRARVTLDAYGDSVVFESSVVAMDPAETMIEGIATYKTTLVFAADDERIKSGMTANIDVLTASRENILTIPQRSVGTKQGVSFILLQGQNSIPVERGIVIGLRGSDGMVEVREGLQEGDRVAGSPEILKP